MAAVFKRLRCKECRHTTEHSQEQKKIPPCPRCGGVRVYGDKWYGRLMVDGKKTVKALSSKKGDAIIEHGRMMSDRGEGLLQESDITIITASKDFLQWVDGQAKLNLIAKGTALYYRQRIENHIVPTWGKIKLRTFVAHAEDYVDRYRSQRINEVAPATINREISVLKRLLNWCRSRKLIRSEPLAKYPSLPENNESDRTLSDSEIKSLLEASHGHSRLFILIGLNTGLRIEGVVTLKWSEIDFKANEISKVVKHHRKKGPREVRIPMTSTLRQALLDWKTVQKVVNLAGYVVPSPKRRSGYILPTSEWGFKKACKDAKITDITFHTLRRTFATRFLEKTGDVHTLCSLMGHSPSEAYRITMRYARILNKSRHEKMKLFEEVR